MPQRDDIPGSELPSAIPDDGPGIAAPVCDAPPGYEILGELGRGGMGVVYKARDRRLKRVVALKMLLGGAHAGGEGRVRFHNEAEAVARLAHPNIVSVYEVGSHRGLPFLAMEYCGGGTLSAAAGGRPQNPRRAATLLASVARAVQAAHDAGIVHRDLKPGNILFTAGGEGAGRDAPVPKVADFGLAKRLDSDGTSDPTRTGAALGTPAYMAPEQMNDARSVGPAADIYALGAILYELLTGRPPFLAESEANAVYLVLTQEPVNVRRLQPKVPADLETICHRCLAKEPRGRYRSAGELAADLTRFLRGEPIRARPVGALERTVRWVRRHPAWAGLLGVSAAALLAGVAGLAAFADRERRAARDLSEQRDRVVAEQARTAEQRDRAERARAEAEAARSEAVQERDRAEAARAEAETNHRRAEENFALARRAVAECLDLARRDPVFQAPGAEAAKALLLRTAVPYHERLALSGGGTAEVRREFAAAGFEAGLAGGAVSAKLEAVASFRKALPELRRLSEENPADAGRLHEWATCHNNIGALLMEIGRPEEALADLAAGLELMRRLSAAHPDNPEYRNDLAAAHGNIAGLHLYTGRPAEGLAVYVELDRFLQSLIAAFPTKGDYYEDLSLCRVNAAGALEAMGRVSESLERLDQARTAIEPVRRGAPHHVRIRAVWADLRHRRAHRLAGLGRSAEASAELRAARDEFADLAAAHPDLPKHRESLARTEWTLAKLDADLGRSAEAIAGLQSAVDRLGRLSAAAPGNGSLAATWLQARSDLGARLWEAGRRDAAAALFGEVRSAQEALAAREAGMPDRRHELAVTEIRLARALSGTDPDAAERLLAAADRRLADLAARHPDVVDYREARAEGLETSAEHLAGRGRAGEADRPLAAAVRLREQLAAIDPAVRRPRAQLAATLRRSAALLRQLGRSAEAEAADRRASEVERGIAQVVPETRRGN